MSSKSAALSHQTGLGQSILLSILVVIFKLLYLNSPSFALSCLIPPLGKVSLTLPHSHWGLQDLSEPVGQQWHKNIFGHSLLCLAYRTNISTQNLLEYTQHEGLSTLAELRSQKN